MNADILQGLAQASLPSSLVANAVGAFLGLVVGMIPGMTISSGPLRHRKGRLGQPHVVPQGREQQGPEAILGHLHLVALAAPTRLPGEFGGFHKRLDLAPVLQRTVHTCRHRSQRRRQRWTGRGQAPAPQQLSHLAGIAHLADVLATAAAWRWPVR